MRCDVCQREYGVYAIGLFCPDCGSRSRSQDSKKHKERLSLCTA
jgi:hypothetical protein